MRVFLNEMHDTVRYDPVLRGRILKTIRRFIQYEDIPDAELGVILSGDRHLSELNSRFRNREETTDVLSFPFLSREELEQARTGFKNFILGEIYISVDRALAQAGEDGQSTGETLIYLLVHGLYHLLGYDHDTDTEREKMNSMVDSLLKIV